MGVKQAFKLSELCRNYFVGGWLAAIRAAFQATMTDRAFLDEIKANELDFDPLAGEKLQEIVRRVENVPPGVIETARKYSEVQK